MAEMSFVFFQFVCLFEVTISADIVLMIKKAYKNDAMG